MIIIHPFKPIKESKFNKFCRSFNIFNSNDFYSCTVDIEITDPHNYYIPSNLNKINEFEESVIIRIENLMYSKSTNELVSDSKNQVDYYKRLLWYKGPFNLKVTQVPLESINSYQYLTNIKPWSCNSYLQVSLEINLNEYNLPKNAIINELDSHDNYKIIIVPIKLKVHAYEWFDSNRGYPLSNNELDFLESYIKSIKKKEE